ncbi:MULTISPECIES: STAS domain-containing protein [unclassified Streptomyces]|uniref:STAS domain-containing protein n=1 Tax=unclassified Streptomyces TaxID=2593676 RepID=UPI0005A760A7|nr:MULTISPECIES: STAS domain-containing protein [unclassified Streptomyces]ODA70918.1 Anti-sigma F factor antagonist [Streptomyces sp. AVP053U2]
MTEPEHLLTVTPRQAPAGPFVLEVTGELDHHSARLLSQAVKEAPFDSHGVILDLSGLTYCDSTGITVLLTAHQRSQTAGSPLSLAGVNPDQMRVFQVVGLDQVFTFHATTQEAVSALRR